MHAILAAFPNGQRTTDNGQLTNKPCKCDGPAPQTSDLQDEVRFLGGVLNINVAGVCRIRTRARGARRTNLRSVPGSIPGSDTVMLDAIHDERLEGRCPMVKHDFDERFFFSSR